MTDRMRAFRNRVDAEGWICPNPLPWNAFWEMLPGKQRAGAGWNPSLPLILGAWGTSALYRKLRFLEHLNWADEHGESEAVIDYLESPSPNDWYRL